jgi:hypothetical protein
VSFQGKENVYTCSRCGGFTVTVDVAEGVTPFMIGCRASGKSGDCSGDAYSAFYPKKPWPVHVPTTPAWEWYRPGRGEVRRLDRASREHVKNGGLLLRKRSVADSHEARA